MWDLLKLVIVDTHEGNLRAAALVELVATGLTAETLEQQLSAEVTEGQCKEGLPHLSVKHRHKHQDHGKPSNVIYVLNLFSVIRPMM